MTEKFSYTSNEGKENQRIHLCSFSTNHIHNKIEYREKTILPEKLLKFYSVNQNSVEALTNNYLFAANPLMFNDPFDCPLENWELEIFTTDKIKEITSPEFHFLFSDDIVENRHVFFRIIWGSLGIICLNAYQPENIDLLWGYYTDQKGFAISFNILGLTEKWGEPFNVEYMQREELDYFHRDASYKKEALKKLQPKILRWSTQKKKIWRNENEWRFIFFNCKIDPRTFETIIESRKKGYSSSAINHIYLGPKFFNENRYIKQSEKQFVFITCEKDQHHKELLSYLSFPNKLKVSHIFMHHNRLELLPRKCRIYEQKDGRFVIKYLE